MLWKKSDAGPADWVTRFTVGDDYLWDRLLLPYDLRASEAHAWGLHQIEVLTDAEWADIQRGLSEIGEAFETGEITVEQTDEDCHTVIETELTRRIGEAGKRVHTGRSRNDQVLAALRLFLRDALDAAAAQTADLADALITLGEPLGGVLMPGYTHQQRAMPTTPASWALGYAELLLADIEAIRAARAQVNTSPLGSAAGYGVPTLALPREAVAERLGFADESGPRVQTHVAAVQLSRGKMEAHVLFALVQVAATLNRLAADLVLFASAEFGFVRMPREYTTGSSIMPQKRNPDVAELARGTYHRLTSELHLLLHLPANLPSGYHRDLQLTKEAVMRGTLRASDLLTAMNHLVPGLGFDEARLADATSPELFATAHALEAVQRGVPFRDAYKVAAEAVDTLATPPAEDSLAAYSAPGFPGQEQADALLTRLAKLRNAPTS